jgi:protocatechuate 4,5-dioxygenase beta chain
VLELIAAGGNIYYLAKFAGIFNLDVQDVGAQQTGMTKDEFKEKLRQGGRLEMARILGGLTTSHIPAVGNAIDKEMFDDPYWKPFFDGYPPIREWLADNKPDVAINIYNDHGLGFFLDKMPTFAIGAAHEYRQRGRGLGHSQLRPVPGRAGAELAHHREHGGPRVRHHLLPGAGGRSRFHRADAAVLAGCAEQPGHAARGADQRQHGAASDPDAEALPTISARRSAQGASRLSGRPQDRDPRHRRAQHQLDGERAGFINKTFDEYCMEKIVTDPEELTKISRMELVEKAGAQGTEFLMWMMMRGALGDDVTVVHSNYHIPISNTGAGTMMLECAA